MRWDQIIAPQAASNQLHSNSFRLLRRVQWEFDYIFTKFLKIDRAWLKNSERFDRDKSVFKLDFIETNSEAPTFFSTWGLKFWWKERRKERKRECVSERWRERKSEELGIKERETKK